MKKSITLLSEHHNRNKIFTQFHELDWAWNCNTWLFIVIFILGFRFYDYWAYFLTFDWWRKLLNHTVNFILWFLFSSIFILYFLFSYAFKSQWIQFLTTYVSITYPVNIYSRFFCDTNHSNIERMRIFWARIENSINFFFT